jgi:YbbR domain-containing protein
MLNRLRSWTKLLPTLIISLLVALAVWVLAITSSDPSETKEYLNPVPIEIVGQATNMVIINDLPETISLNLRAPKSIWNQLTSGKATVRAFIDLSGLKEGDHSVPVEIQLSIKPVEIVNYNPVEVAVSLETLVNKQFEIKVVNRGALPVGYQSEEPQLSETNAIVSGASSRVEQVTEIRALLDLSQVRSDINQTIALQAVDANGLSVRDVTVYPDKITLIQAVAQRGGYRNVVVKVVTEGQVANGFRLTSISVFPPTITVFSVDPIVVDNLPGYIDTLPISIMNKTESLTETVDLKLLSNVQVIGVSQVVVKVGIEPVVSSLALSDVKVETIGLATNLKAVILPEKVNIIISGPVPALESLFVNDVRVLVDLSGVLPGKYTMEPVISLNIPGLKIESISPSSFEINISSAK